jgi:hypothetical protein
MQAAEINLIELNQLDQPSRLSEKIAASHQPAEAQNGEDDWA